MKHTEEFKNYIHECTKKRTYVGIGNPYSKILLIGKEAAKEGDDGSVSDWNNHIKNNTCQCLSYSVFEQEDKDNYLYKTWGRNTWSKYQYLIDYLQEKESVKRYVDFLEIVFTTEMNDSPSKVTKTANKESILGRIELFKESKFIQDFPVVILACSNYILNNDKQQQINDTFGVTYDGEKSDSKVYNERNWFYTHHSADGKKLVIHTRQLSSYVSNEMLKDMADVIRNHFDKLGMEYK